jgi:beta-lactamase class A
MPSGELVYEAPGTRHTLLDLASRMIAKSDNTATDHLIARLGRENVEAVQPLFGHRAPELNTPLLMTRELFAIKMAADPGLRRRLRRGPDDEQRRLLEAEIDPRVLSPDSWGNWNGPSLDRSVEWFASAQEVCTRWLGSVRWRPGPA